jgi:hypothetical protein
VVKVKIYAEGGGEGQLLDTLFRQGWTEFFKKAGLAGKMPSVVRGKGRARTYDLFDTAMKNRKTNELPLLLVDSEDQIKVGHTAWQHLKEHDDWNKPTGAEDDHVFLMVQVMETWFLADREMLKTYFKSDFKDDKIPQWPKLEVVSKTSIYDALDSATAECKKKYAKGKISFEMLSRLDPAKVEASCPAARRFLDRLREQS